jgi:phospholipid:diacylglycerol acyltransferase
MARKRKSSSKHQVGGGKGVSVTTKEPKTSISLHEESNENAPPLQEIDVSSSREENSAFEEVVSIVSVDPATCTGSSTNAGSNRRYFRWAIGLWVFNLLLPILLKRAGVLKSNPFEELMSDAVLERMQTVFPHINESIESLTHGFEKTKSVGRELAEKGANANYPIVMVPGFVTSGLEVWAGRDCTKGLFRQRLWAALTGATSFLVETECWRAHMTLDPFTGGDPDGVRVRASEGFAATDYFMMNYWVWGKLIENLAEVGYTPSNMIMEPYDWRLAFPLLEERDGYFTNVKARIESLHKTSGKKVVLATHSMGAMVVHHFFGWVSTSEKHGGGGGGKKWVDKHIETYINIAGSHLGVPKAATALLSGEMSDTVFGGRMGAMVERFFGRRLRRELWSTWGSLWAMLPKGGNALWGPGVDMCFNRTIEDAFCPELSEPDDAMAPLIVVKDSLDQDECLIDIQSKDGDLNSTLLEFVAKQSHSVEEIIKFLTKYGSGLGNETAGPRYASQVGEAKEKNTAWYDVSRSPLPYAPNMKIYCLYGTGLPTERAYIYKRHWDEARYADDEASKIVDPPIIIDPVTDNSHNISYGIKYGDGDGSVPLLSLGYICADAWNRESSGLNPSKSKVYTREYQHKSEFSMDDPMRGGPSSSDHVDILGNGQMMEDFIRIVTNFQTENVTADHIESDILKIAEKINSHPKGGIFTRSKGLFRRLADEF